MRNDLFLSLFNYMKDDKNIILLTGDLGYGMLDVFFETYPERTINLGIAEQSMISISAGLQLEGFKVIVYSISNFPLMRALEQVRNDVIYHSLDVTIISSGGGFSYGALGFTHHAIEDISILRSLPFISILTPSDSEESRSALKFCLETNGPKYIRLEKNDSFALSKISSNPFLIGKIRLLIKGEGIAFIAYGTIIEEVYDAVLHLNDEGIKPSLYSVNLIKPLDIETINKIINSYDHLIVVEEHSIIGGLGSSILEEINFRKFFHTCNIHLKGIEIKYFYPNGSNKYLRGFFGLDSLSLFEFVKKIKGDIYE